MRVVAGILILCFTCMLEACGANSSGQVRDKVEQFVEAAAQKDYATICDQVLAPPLVERLSGAGLTCPEAMQVALGGVRNPTLSVGKVKVTGQRASAITLSAASGQQASIDTIDLVKTSNGWRLD